MWTGFSIYSIYAYGKKVFSKSQSQIEPMKLINNKVNKKLALINNKKSTLNDKLNKVMKVMKILEKKIHTNQVHIV